jgi:hypothetical protein
MRSLMDIGSRRDNIPCLISLGSIHMDLYPNLGVYRPPPGFFDQINSAGQSFHVTKFQPLI